MSRNTTELSEAIERIAEIHEHLAKGEMFRGYRSVPVAVSGACGIVAALAQSRFVPTADGPAFLRYWIVAGAICAVVSASEIAWNYLFHSDRPARRRTRQVVGQLLPCLLAGAGITIALGRGAAFVPLLPGLWALVFSLGVFSTRPYAPRASGWVALFYLCAGTWMLATASGPDALSGWRVGGVFGAGQLAAALVLYWNLERGHDTQEER